MKFRKKPVVIEAEQLTPTKALDCLVNSKSFAFGLNVSGNFNCYERSIYEAHIQIQTLEGTMTANLNDWIIKGVNGELYPCKPDIFEKTYEEVEEVK
jgi:hypothetical protein